MSQHDQAITCATATATALIAVWRRDPRMGGWTGRDHFRHTAEGIDHGRIKSPCCSATCGFIERRVPNAVEDGPSTACVGS
jgi:hypothetical protein